MIASIHGYPVRPSLHAAMQQTVPHSRSMESKLKWVLITIIQLEVESMY
jgi:hypothetical protein